MSVRARLSFSEFRLNGEGLVRPARKNPRRMTRRGFLYALWKLQLELRQIRLAEGEQLVHHLADLAQIEHGG
ncbi:MAG: hypothetical protein SOT57_11640, partial [Eubacteriales bacterium]|nr:hypothetical protein [Eubacteriales bacterium]